jgi:thiosulfate dehydrogenase (quinone) large subunit
MKNKQSTLVSQPLVTSSNAPSLTVSPWRAKGIAALRIIFGLIWLVAAWLKWQPSFIHGFGQMIAGAAQGQFGPIKAWIGIWASLININPQLFAYSSAALETAIAICLLFGFLSNLTYLVGIIYTLGIWSVAEAFGGPYVLGQSTDVGVALLYSVLFAVLLCISAGRYIAIDQWLTPRLGRWGILASASLPTRKRQ